MKINLLPREKVKKRPAYLEQEIFAAVSVGLVLVILVSVWGYLQRSEDSLDKKILDTQSKLQKLKKDEEKIAELKKSMQLFQQKVDVIKRLENSKTGPAIILSEIAQKIPAKMWLKTLKSQVAALTLEGIAIDNETIAQFMTNLEDSPEFENVELQFAQESKLEGFMLKKFSITSTIKPIKELEEAKEAAVSKEGAKKKK